MINRLIGVVALGAATLFLGAVPAYAAHAPAPTAKATTVVTAPAKYVEWSAPAKYVEWSAPATVSRYVEW